MNQLPWSMTGPWLLRPIECKALDRSPHPEKGFVLLYPVQGRPRHSPTFLNQPSRWLRRWRNKCSREVKGAKEGPRFFVALLRTGRDQQIFLGKSRGNVSALARVTPRCATPYSCGAATSPETDAAPYNLQPNGSQTRQ
jgi:hypothetical protein